MDKRFFKKILAVICAAVVAFSTVPLISFAEAVSYYTVSPSHPALPLVEATYTELSTIKVSFDNGSTYKWGNDVEWSLKDSATTALKISEGKLFAFNKGAYVLVASDKSNPEVTTEIVAVVSDKQNGPYNIFEYDFTKATVDGVNEVFGYQAFNSSTSSSNGTATVSANQLTVDGFVNKAAVSGKSRAALYVKDNSIIGKFKNYTVTVTQKHAIGDYNGGGVLARALLDSEKLNTANNQSIAVVASRFNSGKDTAMLFAGATQIQYPGNDAASTDFSYDITANKYYDLSVKFIENDFSISLSDNGAALTQVYNLSEDAGISSTVRNMRYKARYGGTVGLVRSNVDVTVKKMSVSVEFDSYPEATAFKMIKSTNPIIDIGKDELFDFSDYYILLNNELVKVSTLNLSADDEGIKIDTNNNVISGNSYGLFCVSATNANGDTAKFYLHIIDTSVTEKYADNGNYVFTISEDGVLTAYSKKYAELPFSEKIVIPTIYDSVVVKELAANVFKNSAAAPNEAAVALKCVIFEEGIEKIGDSAFNGCTNLEKVELPISLKTVVQYAFGNTKVLESITVYSKDTVIADTAFNLGNSSMKVRAQSESMAKSLAENKGFAFEEISGQELADQQSKYATAKLVIEAHEKAIIETINDAQYKIILDKGYGIGGIVSVGTNKIAGKFVLPTKADYLDANNVLTPNVNVVYVGPNALKNSPYANKIHALTIPEGYVNIGGSAFIRCDNLKVVSLPTTLKTIDSYAFYMDKKLNNIQLDVDLSSLESIGEAAFQNTGIITFKIPFSVKKIAKNAFADSKLAEVWIYNAETIIAENAFPEGTVIHGIDGSTAEAYVSQNADKNYVFVADITDKLGEIMATENTEAQYKIIFDKGYGIGGLLSVSSNKFAGKFVLPSKASYVDANGVTTNDVDIVYIAPNAFYKSTFANSLYSVVVPEGYTGIGGSAFALCENLRSVTLPSTLTSIASYAFSKNTAMYSVALDFENSALTTIGESAFFQTAITEFKVPFAAKTIGKNAFADSALKEVWIYNRTTQIGENAFPEGTVIHGVSGSTAEEFVKANPTLNYVFKSDVKDLLEEKLTSKDTTAKFTITKTSKGNSVTGYEGNGGLVVFPSFYNNDLVSVIGANLFKNSSYSSKLYAVEIEEGITIVQDSAFINCENLMRVKLPSTLCAIDSYAFQNCALDDTVKIYQDCAKIGKHAFYKNPNLKEVYIYNSKCEIGEEAIPVTATIFGIKGSTAEKYAKLNGNKFVEVQPLPEITINSVKDNGNYQFTFKNDTTIAGYERKDSTKPYSEKVVFVGENNGKTVTKIEGNLFKGKPYSNIIVAAVFEEGIGIIGDSAFVNCARLKFVQFPKTLTAIMPYAFQNTALTGDIVFPESLETISANAFSKCLNLKSVTISNPLCEINDDAFLDANPDLIIYGLTGSTAEKFAVLHKFKFVSTGVYENPQSEETPAPDNNPIDQTNQPVSHNKSSLKIVIIIAIAAIFLVVIIVVFILVAVSIKNKNSLAMLEQMQILEKLELTQNNDADLE